MKWFHSTLVILLIGFGCFYIGWQFEQPKVEQQAEQISLLRIQVQQAQIKNELLELQKNVVIYSYLSPGWVASDNFTLLSLDETIRLSYSGASAHVQFLTEGINTEHNSFWRDVHQSAAYWLEKGK